MDAYKNLLALRNKAAAQAKAADKGATFVTDPAAVSRLNPNEVGRAKTLQTKKAPPVRLTRLCSSEKTVAAALGSLAATGNF